jgi:hypothetical protein
MQRLKMQKDLQLLRIRLREQMTILEELTDDPEISFGAVYTDLVMLVLMINKVVEYFSSKVHILNYRETDAKNLMIPQPLFQTLSEPSELQVGHLIDLKCGHTQRPTDVESVMFAVHLEAAGFVKGKGVVGSP